MPYSDYTPETIVARGDAIYQQRRSEVETHHNGKFWVVDINTEDYEIDAQSTVALNRLLSKHPDAVIYLLRIGHQTAYQIGFRATSGTPANKWRYTKPLKSSQEKLSTIKKLSSNWK